MLRALAILALLATGCGSDDSTAVVPDLSVPLHHCPAIACGGHCPGADSHCVIQSVGTDHDMGIFGGCTDGLSTCGTIFNGDCNFTTRCLSPQLLGQLFIPVPEGGCGIELIRCANGCVDADGGAASPHCAP